MMVGLTEGSEIFWNLYFKKIIFLMSFISELIQVNSVVIILPTEMASSISERTLEKQISLFFSFQRQLPRLTRIRVLEDTTQVNSWPKLN